MKLASLAGKLAGFVGARLLGAGFGFISQLVLARLLSVDDVGIVLMGMSAAAFISLGANGGFALLAMTQLPKLATHGRQKLIDAFHSVAATDTIIAFGLLLIAGGAISLVFDLSAGQQLALLMGAICTPASILIRYNGSIATAAREFQLAYVPDFLFRPLAFLLALLGAWFLGFTLSAFVALGLFIAITYATALGQGWGLGRERLGLRHFGFPRKAFSKRLRRRAHALTIVSATMLAFADIVTVLGGFLLTSADVAVLGISMRLAAIAGFILQAGQTLVLSDYTEAIVKRDEVKSNSLLKRINGMTVSIAIAALLGGILLGQYVLAAFGPDYVSGTWLLVLILVGQSIRALGGMNQHLLSINGHQLRTAGACLLALVVLVGLALLLCPRFGLIGMGYAVVGAELTWQLALGAQAQKLCSRRGDLFWQLGTG